MNPEDIMNLVQAYFAGRRPPAATDQLNTLPVTSLLKDSLDVVDFLMYLEEELKLETEIDMNQFGPGLMNRNFGELAQEISRILAERQASTSLS